jgi:RNA polymerase sigma-70 factor (ECF subfamily)
MLENDGPFAREQFARLIAQAKGGDRDALGRLLDQYRRALVRAARQLLPSDLQAKGGGSDLVQETFLDAHKDFARFQGTTADQLEAWLRCLLRNNIANFYRSFRSRLCRQVGREVTLAGVGAGRAAANDRSAAARPDEQTMQRESVRRCQRALEQLADVCRDLVHLRFHERLSFPEIGQRLTMSPEAARKLLTRTLRRMGTELEDRTA